MLGSDFIVGSKTNVHVAFVAAVIQYVPQLPRSAALGSPLVWMPEGSTWMSCAASPELVAKAKASPVMAAASQFVDVDIRFTFYLLFCLGG
jgi:hypothetical protein